MENTIQDGMPQFARKSSPGRLRDARRRPKRPQETPQGSTLKANLGPCWPLKSIRNCPRRPQDAPKTRLGAIVSIFRRPDRILAPFWLDFGRFWASFWKVFGAQGHQDRQNDAKLTPQFSSILESIFKAFLKS